MSDTTQPLANPNWEFGQQIVGFAQRLNIIQPSYFEDEPTIPFGLCRDLVVEESDIIDEEIV